MLKYNIMNLYVVYINKYSLLGQKKRSDLQFGGGGLIRNNKFKLHIILFL
jgi:hypothetical protein